MNKKVFISYSRKDTLDIAEFKTIKKFRDFEIVIDDEEVPFNQLWKDNIRQKINDSDAAIFFISKNALNPESPIRSLEIPLISKRLRDPDDDFNFFPIFLEDVEKELDSYTFTTLKDAKEVKFLDFFQIYDIEKQNTLENLSSRMRKRFFRNINANISQVLKGGTLSPGQELITKLSRIQKIRWALGVLSVVLGLGWFTTTDAYARILIAAYEQRIESGEVAADSPTVRFLADQLDSVENLDSLTNDESLKESIAEVAELNLKLNLDDDLQNIDLSGTVDESTTTTLGTTTTTLGTTNSVDTDAPTFDKGLTAENVTSSTVDISWSATDNIGISYYVLREGSFVIYEGSNTSKEVEGLISSKNYTFSVDAYDSAGNFSTSNVSFVTLPSTTTTSTTTSTTMPNSITASTVAELVGCLDGSEVGESAVRLWITNTSSSDAYFDVQYTTDSGSTWTVLSDGEFISSSAALMFLTPNFANNTTVLWQWRGALTNPSSGSYNYGSSITVSGCPVTTTTTVPQIQYPYFVAFDFSGPSQSTYGEQILYNFTFTLNPNGHTLAADYIGLTMFRNDAGNIGCVASLPPSSNSTFSGSATCSVNWSENTNVGTLLGLDKVNIKFSNSNLIAQYENDGKFWENFTTGNLMSHSHGFFNTSTITEIVPAQTSCSGVSYTLPPDDGLYVWATVDVDDCTVLTTGFECKKSSCGNVINTTGIGSPGGAGRTQAYVWISYANYLSNWTGYYKPSSGTFYVYSSGQGSDFEFSVPFEP